MNRMLSAAFAVATLAGVSAPVHAADATEKQILLSSFTLAAAHMACPNIEVNNGRDGDAGWALTNSVDGSYKNQYGAALAKIVQVASQFPTFCDDVRNAYGPNGIPAKELPWATSAFRGMLK
jgi:hypothetical protein